MNTDTTAARIAELKKLRGRRTLTRTVYNFTIGWAVVLMAAMLDLLIVGAQFAVRLVRRQPLTAHYWNLTSKVAVSFRKEASARKVRAYATGLD